MDKWPPRNALEWRSKMTTCESGVISFTKFRLNWGFQNKPEHFFISTIWCNITGTFYKIFEEKTWWNSLRLHGVIRDSFGPELKHLFGKLRYGTPEDSWLEGEFSFWDFAYFQGAAGSTFPFAEVERIRFSSPDRGRMIGKGWNRFGGGTVHGRCL